MSYRGFIQRCLQRCPIKVSYRGVLQRFPSYRGVLQRCPIEVYYRGVLYRCTIDVVYRGVLYRCTIEVYYIGVLQRYPKRCPIEFSYRSVLQRCPVEVSCRGVLQQCPVQQVADSQTVPGSEAAFPTPHWAQHQHWPSQTCSNISHKTTDLHLRCTFIKPQIYICGVL